VFTNILSAGQQAILERLSSLPALDSFYLAGGTGLALQLGHRRSVDFDFFRPEGIDPGVLLPSLQEFLPAVRRAEAGTLTLELAGVMTSFFEYRYPLLRPIEEGPWAVRLASVADIAAMKIAAIAGRGSRKDFMDLFIICREVMPLRDVLDCFELKFRGVGYERYHILKSLVYFDDAEREPPPDMIRPVAWMDVTRFLSEESARLF
jgi:hypothetical protein